MPHWIEEITDWWTALPPEWMLLFGLPFLLAAVAFVADGLRR